MKSRRILSIIGLILAAVLLLGIGFAIGRNEVQASVPDATDAVRSQDGAPPKELWYLGGAPILDDFSTSGGPEGTRWCTDNHRYLCSLEFGARRFFRWNPCRNSRW